VRPARAAARLGALAIAVSACAGAGADAPLPPHTRRAYETFRAGYPNLLEPNYLPFMATPVRVESRARRLFRRAAGGLGFAAQRPPEMLVFCRWNESDFPLAVYVEPPRIPPELALDLAGREPEDYVAAVERAFRLWESGLEGLVRFERAASERGADLVLRLTADRVDADDPTVQVLGTTPLGGACRVRGGAPADGRLDVRFEVPELRVHVADEWSLLLPDQVERIALHEIGHALGMRTHSPIPADLMYPVVRDRLPRGELGTEDVNSFVSLYSLPNGAIYRVLPDVPEPPAEPPVPVGPPEVELAPHVDARLGYEIQLPRGWTSLETGYGVIAVDGVTWDYEASFQVIVRGFATVDDYLDRYHQVHLGRGRIAEARTDRVAGRPARRYRVDRGDGRTEGVVLIEGGDGRVVVVLWDCPTASRDRFLPWFEISLATLEIRAARSPDRDYLGSRPAP
jgi:hypothetical protein